jgi:broad-specificity NMP kinase
MAEVLIIGGAPASGKTTLAHQMEIVLGATVFSLDEMVAGESERMLQQERIWDEPERVGDLLRSASVELAPILDALVHRFQNEAAPTIIEGARISPGMVAELIDEIGPTLKVVFLIEPNPDVLRANLALKSQAYRLLDTEKREVLVQVNSEYGRLLEIEAQTFRLPVVHPQPWSTLWLRASQALKASSRRAGTFS